MPFAAFTLMQWVMQWWSCMTGPAGGPIQTLPSRYNPLPRYRINHRTGTRTQAAGVQSWKAWLPSRRKDTHCSIVWPMEMPA